MNKSNYLPASALDVSNFIIDNEYKNNRTINLQKLSHLLYKAQGYSLNILKKPAFYDTILTTEHITVFIPSVVNAFIQYKNEDITSLYRIGSEYPTYMMLLDKAIKESPNVFKEARIELYPFTHEEQKIFSKICDVYKEWDGNQLHHENNNESSLIQNIRNTHDLSTGQIIPILDIINEFKMLMDKNILKEKRQHTI